MTPINDTHVKDPDASLPYEWDWAAWLSDGETITGTVITADPGITVGASPPAAATSPSGRRRSASAISDHRAATPRPVAPRRGATSQEVGEMPKETIHHTKPYDHDAPPVVSVGWQADYEVTLSPPAPGRPGAHAHDHGRAAGRPRGP